MLNTIIGASLFGLPSLLAGYLGSYGPAAYLVAGAGMAEQADFPAIFGMVHPLRRKTPQADAFRVRGGIFIHGCGVIFTLHACVWNSG